MAYLLSNKDILALSSKNLKPEDIVVLSNGTELKIKESSFIEIGNCAECHFDDKESACGDIPCSQYEREDKEFKHAIYFTKCHIDGTCK